MIRTRFARVAAVTASLALAVTMSACSSDDSSSDTANSTDTKASATPSAMPSTAAQFGPACAGVPTDASNPGSFEGMAKDPVATAASHNEALKTLVAAVTAAGLGDTLNNAKDITVFAPTNDAFAKIPKADLDKVLADKATLTKILTYHVVGKRITPAELGTAGPVRHPPGRHGPGRRQRRGLHRRQGRQGRLRQHPDRQRHRLHHRQRAHADCLIRSRSPPAFGRHLLGV